MKRRLTWTFLLLVVTMPLAGCGGGSAIGKPAVASLSLGVTGPATLLVGQTAQLTPTARDANNSVIRLPASSFTYSSGSAANVSVNGSGLITALICNNPAAPVSITATERSSGVAATIPITVAVASGGLGPHTVVYTSDRDGYLRPPANPRTLNIYVDNLDSGIVTQLTHNEGLGSSMNGAPSPDGTKIVFASNRTGNYEIYIMNADGNNVLPVTANGATNDVPRFSSDSMKIIFSSSLGKSGSGAVQDSNGRDLYTAPVPGTASVPIATRLTTTGDGVFNLDPQYSPDNTKISFAVRAAGSNTVEVFVMNADGTGVRQLTSYGAITRWPQYSPDGSQILYTSNGGAGNTDCNLDLINSDGSGQRVLLSGLPSGEFGSGIAPQAAFFPDGTIVYSSLRAGHSHLFLLNGNGTSADATPAGILLQGAYMGLFSDLIFPHVRLCP